MKTRTAVVLAAHGSGDDPAASDLVEQQVSLLSQAGVVDEVVAAFHQGAPGFGEVLDGLTAEQVLVVPLFTSEGYYTSEVLPRGLKLNRRFPRVRLRQTRPVGSHPAVTDMLVRRVEKLAGHYGLELQQTTLLLVGHGTVRNPRSRDTTLDLVDRLARAGIAAEVRAGFLDHNPSVESALAEAGYGTVIVLPFLLGGGRHATRDLPARIGLTGAPSSPLPRMGQVNGRFIALDQPFGAGPELSDIILALVRAELPAPAGSVALVGAGPGDPGLITVRGLELLRQADVVLHDRLIPVELLAQARPGALIIDVGKRPGSAGVPQSRINRLLVQHARQGGRVVRLKGGDPFVFGRGAEEVDACGAAGIPCSVVPGVSSAVAVPAAAGIPLTERGVASSVAVLTGHSHSGLDVGALAARCAGLATIDTVVALMSRGALAQLAASLIAAGRSPDTPVACVQDGTTADQRVVTGTLGTIVEVAELAQLRSPMVTVVGDVARRAVVPVPC